MTIRHKSKARIITLLIITLLIVGCAGMSLEVGIEPTASPVSGTPDDGIFPAPTAADTSTGEVGIVSTATPISPVSGAGDSGTFPAPTDTSSGGVGGGADVTAEGSPPPTEDGAMGTVAGNLCYPSERIPPMTLYFQPVGGETAYTYDVQADQTHYQYDLLPGEYYAYAWVADYFAGGSYSESIRCDIGDDCAGSDLASFTIQAGQATAGIDICDWYGGVGSVPLPPGIEPGSISGSLNGAITATHVVAFNTHNSTNYTVEVNADQSYTLVGLSPGLYIVAAYNNGELAGAYTRAVECGLGDACSDHNPVFVDAIPGSALAGIDPLDPNPVRDMVPGIFPPS